MSTRESPYEIDPDSGLPIGPVIRRSQPAQPPGHVVLEGRYVRLEPLDASRHGDDLFAASTPPDASRRFRYLPDAAPTNRAAYQPWLDNAANSTDPMFWAVIDRLTGRAEGRQSYLRITPNHQSIEIGNIYWGPAIAGTRIATEANYLFACHAFDVLGYRRYEWKCDSLNAASRRAAERFGFSFEGIFRRHFIIRGRSRDTAWFAMVEDDWPDIKAAYERWLDPENFDTNGHQRRHLAEWMPKA